MSDGVAVRRLALDALVRIESDGAYANLALGPLLERSALEPRDRGFVTELVYGTTRMRRACQHLVQRHRDGGVSDRVAAALRLGAYQLAFAGVPVHAAVDATVSATPKPARGLVNAVLRRIADDVAAGIDWPDEPTRLSYPDWVVRELQAMVPDGAGAALEAMNLPAPAHVRDDGYVQDLASQAVVDMVDARPGMTVADVCAAPGGKATGIAARGARVVAGDRSVTRAGLVVANAARVGAAVTTVVADAASPPLRPASFDRVLVDAPCSGLGVLRRRPDARWRIDDDAPARLAPVQRSMLTAAATLVAPGGRLVYSVCTLTLAETRDVVAESPDPGLVLAATETLVPDAETDGMFVAIWERRPATPLG